MEPAAKRVLCQQRKYVIENIYDVSPILDYLISADIVTCDMKEEIEANRTRSSCIGALLDMLPYRGHRAMDEFCRALDETGYAFLANHLREQLAETIVKVPAEEVEAPDWLFALLDQHARCRLVTEKEMSSVARKLSPTEFFAVGIELGFTRSRLEQYQASAPHSVQTQSLKMLCDWLAKEGGNATVVSFTQHMRQAGIDDNICKAVMIGR